MSKLYLFLRGIGMGIADLIPGVSGGTIAFITGIYERLVSALHNIDHHSIKLLFKFKIKEFLRKIDGGFLFTVIAGAATSILLFSRLIKYLLVNYEVFLWAFFFGLILASIWVILKKIKKWSVAGFGWFVVGTAVAYFITSTGSLHLPDGAFFVFLSGFIAIIAMILPGISGSYILLILGKYAFVIELVSTVTKYIEGSLKGILSKGSFDYLVKHFPASELGLTAIFVIGCGLGLISFSKILNWLFKKYHDTVISVLAGFMFGSLNIIWPWKKTIGTFLNHKGIEQKIQENIFPALIDANFFYLIGFIVLGIIIVYFLDKLAILAPNAKNQINTAENTE